MATDMKTYMAERRMTRRAKLIELAGGQCFCGSSDKLEFDHINPETKLFVLSGCHLDKAWSKILDELAKCQLLCQKHHREKTNANSEHRGGHNKIDRLTLVHGTARMYEYGDCRCERCKLAKRMYRNKQIDIDSVAG